MADAFRDPKHIPGAFIGIARELMREDGPKEIRRECASMKVAQALRARWYHCRRIAGSHTATDAQQAEDFFALKNVSVRVSGTHVVYYKSAKEDLESVLQAMEEEFRTEPAARPAPTPTPAPAPEASRLYPKAQDAIMEKWLKRPEAAQSAPGEAEGARNVGEGEGEG